MEIIEFLARHAELFLQHKSNYLCFRQNQIYQLTLEQVQLELADSLYLGSTEYGSQEVFHFWNDQRQTQDSYFDSDLIKYSQKRDSGPSPQSAETLRTEEIMEAKENKKKLLSDHSKRRPGLKHSKFKKLEDYQGKSSGSHKKHKMRKDSVSEKNSSTSVKNSSTSVKGNSTLIKEHQTPAQTPALISPVFPNSQNYQSKNSIQDLVSQPKMVPVSNHKHKVILNSPTRLREFNSTQSPHNDLTVLESGKLYLRKTTCRANFFEIMKQI